MLYRQEKMRLFVTVRWHIHHSFNTVAFGVEGQSRADMYHVPSTKKNVVFFIE